MRTAAGTPPRRLPLNTFLNGITNLKKRLLLASVLALGVIALSGCDNKNDVIQAQQLQIQQLSQTVAQLQQACTAPACQQAATAAAPLVQAPAAAPVYVQQPTVIREHDSGGNDLLTGMVLGHMLSGSGGGGGYGGGHTTSTQVVNNHYNSTTSNTTAAPKTQPVKRSWFADSSPASTATASKSTSSYSSSRSTVSRSSFSSGARSAFHASRSSGRR